MLHALSNAEVTDTTDASFHVIAICLVVMTAVCLLAFIPIAISWNRTRRRNDALLAAAVFWALLAGGMAAYGAMEQFRWTNERDLSIKTGYYSPTDNTGAPQFPLALWAGLAGGYGVLIVWSCIPGRAHQRPRTNPTVPGA
jgi:phosphotransferase system  glucose/maltose/N-acetylglucosamine-specific IIC component